MQKSSKRVYIITPMKTRYIHSPAILDEHGVLRWEVNNAVISPSTMRENGRPAFVNWENQQAAYKAEIDAFLEECRKIDILSDVDRLEALNEVGPNAVNVLTGKRV